MPSDWVPGRPLPRLRVFFISLVVLFVCLLGMLFGVRLEAVVPATGIITARNLQAIRARIGGLIEPGWYEGEVDLAGQTFTVRLDAEGNGISDPAAGPVRVVRQERMLTGQERLVIQRRQFHMLQPGDLLWPGQPLAVIADEALRAQWQRADDQYRELLAKGETGETLKRERDRLRDWMAQGAIRAPETAACWLVLEVPAEPLQQVNAGDLLARIVPVDPATHEPLDLVARLEVDEKHWAAVQVGEKVRLACAMHNPRLAGHAEATIERLEPWGEPGPDDTRRFHALAPITKTPYRLPLGSSFHAEIGIGRKPVYRIILEH